MTLKQAIIEAAEHYDSSAKWSKQKADQATDGSDIQKEIRESQKYKEGKAAAMYEALQIIERYIGV